jgi:hypothetical protein
VSNAVISSGNRDELLTPLSTRRFRGELINQVFSLELSVDGRFSYLLSLCNGLMVIRDFAL